MFKVWADLKNNTKKRQPESTNRFVALAVGLLLPLSTHLTPLEERVLNIIGVQVATGLALQEAGLTQVRHISITHSSRIIIFLCIDLSIIQSMWNALYLSDITSISLFLTLSF